MRSARITYIALLTALAAVFGYIESLFPIPVPIPGIKLGISNIAVLFALYKMNKSDAFFVMLLKVIICALLFSGMSGFLYSLSGGLMSFFAMCIFKRAGLSVVGTSMAGGVFHNLGQITAAAVMLSSLGAFCYFPVLMIAGLIVGTAVGALCSAIIARFK